MGDGFYRSKDPTNSIKVQNRLLLVVGTMTNNWLSFYTTICCLKRPDSIVHHLIPDSHQETATTHPACHKVKVQWKLTGAENVKRL